MECLGKQHSMCRFATNGVTRMVMFIMMRCWALMKKRSMPAQSLFPGSPMANGVGWHCMIPLLIYGFFRPKGCPHWPNSKYTLWPDILWPEIYKLIFPHSNYLIFKVKNWSTINIFQCFLVDSLRLIHPTNYQLLYKIAGWIKERSDESTKVNNIKELFSL